MSTFNNPLYKRRIESKIFKESILKRLALVKRVRNPNFTEYERTLDNKQLVRSIVYVSFCSLSIRTI